MLATEVQEPLTRGKDPWPSGSLIRTALASGGPSKKKLEGTLSNNSPSSVGVEEANLRHHAF